MDRRRPDNVDWKGDRDVYLDDKDCVSWGAQRPERESLQEI